MKFKIDGSYVNGTDIGHPDGVDIFTACCCGFVAGDTSEERDANARLIAAAPEMYELMCAAVRFLQTASQYHPLTVTEEKWEQKALELMAKIEGGGE